MPFFLYVFDADAQPSLFDEVAELEESVAICEELVAEEGYPRAEVWSAAGDRLYGVAREGGALRTFGQLDDAEGADGADGADDGAAPRGREAAPAQPTADAAPKLPLDRLFGERPERPEQWFGL